MGTQLFDEVVGELPPSTVNVDDIVRREKRRGAVRRTTGIVAAVVTLSVTTGLGLTIGGGTGTSSPPVASAATPETRFALVADNAETATATAKRLQLALDGAVRRQAPGATWLTGEPPAISFKTTRERIDMFTGEGNVAYDGRKGGLHLGISLIRPIADGPNAGKTIDPLTCAADAKCVEGKAPNGAQTALTLLDGTVIGRVGLPDNRLLQITVSNEIGPDGAGQAQAATPLTGDQALAVAIDLASQVRD
jgi:hypothetical protein